MSRRRLRLLGAVLAAVALVGAAGWWLGGWTQRDITEYHLASGTEVPAAIAAGPDGTVWFSLDGSDTIGRVRDGEIRRLPRGAQSVEPLGLAVAPDGAAWSTDVAGRAVTRITGDGRVTAYPLSTSIARLGRLAVAPDGAVWFADRAANSVTRLRDGRFTQHPLPTPDSSPFGVAVDRQGTVWAALGATSSLVRITAQGSVEEIRAPAPQATLNDVAAASDGSVWMVELRVNRIARYRDGRFTEYGVPGPSAGLTSLAVAPNGDVWFTELVRHRVGRLRDGRITEFSVPRDGARPFSLTVDRGGNVWYADLEGRIGRIGARAARSTCRSPIAGVDVCWPA